MKKQVKQSLNSGMPVKFQLVNYGLSLMLTTIKNTIRKLWKTLQFTRNSQKRYGFRKYRIITETMVLKKVVLKQKLHQ